MSPELVLGVYIVGVMLWSFVAGLLGGEGEGLTPFGVLWPMFAIAAVCALPLLGPYYLARWIKRKPT